MKVIKILLIAVLAFTVVNINAAEKKAAKETKAAIPAKKVTVGSVIALDDAVMGLDTKLTKDKAVQIVKSRGVLVLMSGTGKTAKMYFVYNPDGSLASNKLAPLADGQVSVTGPIKTIGGVNFIVSDVIEAKK